MTGQDGLRPEQRNDHDNRKSEAQTVAAEYVHGKVKTTLLEDEFPDLDQILAGRRPAT